MEWCLNLPQHEYNMHPKHVFSRVCLILIDTPMVVLVGYTLLIIYPDIYPGTRYSKGVISGAYVLHVDAPGYPPGYPLLQECA